MMKHIAPPSPHRICLCCGMMSGRLVRSRYKRVDLTGVWGRAKLRCKCSKKSVRIRVVGQDGEGGTGKGGPLFAPLLAKYKSVLL